MTRPIASMRASGLARTGLTGFVAGLARQTVAHNVTINGLLPGPFDTDRLRGNFAFNAKKRVHAGFITGQNLLMDGGHFPGTL